MHLPKHTDLQACNSTAIWEYKQPVYCQFQKKRIAAHVYVHMDMHGYEALLQELKTPMQLLPSPTYVHPVSVVVGAGAYIRTHHGERQEHDPDRHLVHYRRKPGTELKTFSQ